LKMPGEDYSREFCGCQLVLPIFVLRQTPILRVRTCLEEDFHCICPKKGPAVLASVTKNLLVVAQ